jgi:nucleoside-diphosphate-sugar epimerase
VRNDGQLRHFERLGLRARRGDILDVESLVGAIRGCHVALHLATAVPPPQREPADFTHNDRSPREGTANLVLACQSVGVHRYVQQSVAFLVADGSPSVLDETAPVRRTPVTASAADMESIVAESRLDWVILRGGLLYGPGTGRDDHWRQLARIGDLRWPNDGSDYVSLVHVTDMADAVAIAVGTAPSRAVLAVVDDAPVTYATLFRHVASVEDGPEPQDGGPAGLPSFRIANARARKVLGWTPRIATYRAGLA